MDCPAYYLAQGTQKSTTQKDETEGNSFGGDSPPSPKIRAEREQKIEGVRKLKRIVKASILLMAILTVIYAGLDVYANANSSYGSSGDGKEPIEYGIWKSYLAEKLETEPQEWNTTEELGIIFGDKMEYAKTETYLLLIVDEEKALPWMNGTTPEPYAVKHEDKFYHIVFLWTTPGLPEHVRQWQIPTGAALGVCWVFSGVLFSRARARTKRLR